MLKKAAAFCFNKVKRVVIFHQVAPVDKSEDNRHVENNTTLKRVETCAQLCNCYKDIGNRMQ